MLGEEVNWVRNVRAVGDEVALRHGRREEVHLQEVVAPELRAPVLKAYLERASNASAHMPIDKDAPLEEVERFAPRFPVFRGLDGPEWRFVELSTGHWPMFSRPKDLAKLLLDLPSQQPVRADARAS